VQKYLADVGITCNLETWNNAIYDERQVKGWNKTGILAPGAGRFFATSMESYFLTPNYYVSLQVPPGLEEAVHEALATVELEKEKVEKISRIIFDNASMIPIHYMGAGRVFYKEQLHNAGFLDYTSFTEWSPAEAWLSR
jgi:ABC-type transport system substrate-binding protein